MCLKLRGVGDFMPTFHHGQPDEKNGNPIFSSINNESDLPSEEKQDVTSTSISKQNTAQDSDGLPALKSFTMHGFKDSGSSPNPPDQVSLEDKNKRLAGVPQEQLFFTESMIMDYVTLKGIENRFGVKRQDIPVTIFKELFDNALDHVETLALTSSNHDFIPEIHVQISRYGDGITLQVSNPDITSNFTFERIQSIFNFNNFTSTKRNQYKISRGALGNGLKAILGMSYALATESYNYDGWSPLKIKTGKKQYSIRLEVDDINRKDRPISPDINTEECDADNKISVEIDIPIDGKSILSEMETINLLTQTFRNYTILNPHIAMNITVHGEPRSFPQVQKIKTDWNNLDSIYHYSCKEFENLILSSGADDLTLYDFVSNSIRLTESSKLKKRDWNIPISEVLNNRTLIHKLYLKLRKLGGPKEKLDLPYDMRIKPRKDAIVKRLSQWGIVVESIKYQSYNGPSNSNSEDVRFPYFFESAEIKIVNHTTKYEIISGINSTISKLETMENPDESDGVQKELVGKTL